MVDLIESSNLEEITQVLEDMDNLDMKLFNNTFKKSKSSTSIFKDSNVQLDGEIKRKVIFKDPNDDDSLTGLLSDEETSLKEKKNLFATGSKSSLMEDLFKIKTPIPSTTSTKSNNELESMFNFEQRDVNQLFSQKPSSHLASKNNSILLENESSKEKHVQKLKDISKNEEDILANLIDKSSMVDDKSKRSSLRENLFDNKSWSSVTMDFIIPKNIKKVETEVPLQSAELVNTIQKPISQPTDQSTKLFTRESRRGRRNTKIINDPLGLLPTDLLSEPSLELVKSDNMPTRDSTIQSSKLEKNLPEWLGGTKKLEEKKLNEIKEGKEDKVGKISTSTENIESQNVKNTTDSMTAAKNGSKSVLVPEHFSLLFGTQFNQQAAIMTMQQQEHELRTATVLSQQNEQLNKVSDAQHSILCNQEKQFNSLLKLQLEKQLLLEKQINMQQERINQYIHTLMAQPISVSSTTSVYTTCKSEDNGREKNLIYEKEEIENTVKILQVEKSKLESTLSTINERHDSEMTSQAEFYKKQISFLKEAVIKLEERARQEIEFLEADYMAKFEKLRNEKTEIENLYKEEIHNLKSEHGRHIEELDELHSRNVKLLQKEYSNIIESICKAKQTEDQIIQTMTNRKVDIEDMLQKANFIIGSMKENKEKIELKDNEIIEHRENYLKVYEDNIKAQQLDLKNQNSVLEEHRNKFIKTTEKFGTRLTQLLTELEKQTTQSNQAQEMLENRAANLLRERELFEEKVKWERDYLQTLKESWMKEQERQLRLLAEERERVASEKAQLEILSRLKTNSGDIAKIELEAAIKTAQEATACANREKLKWQEKVNELNVHKQILQDKENLLVSRAKELENLTQSALTKKEEGIKALKDAKHLQNQHKEKLGLLQMQLKVLMEKEKTVANEQYNVAKGRMISVSCETEKPERDINVLHNFRSEILPFSVMHSTSQTTSELMKIVDPNLIMLKLNLDDNYDTIT